MILFSLCFRFFIYLHHFFPSKFKPQEGENLSVAFLLSSIAHQSASLEHNKYSRNVFIDFDNV